MFPIQFQSLFFWNRYFDKFYSFFYCLALDVSILVFLESVFRPEFDGDIPVQFAEFQSLFFWNRYFDLPVLSILFLFQKCFNPCFSGIGISTLLELDDVLDELEFQSLFFWNRYFDMQRKKTIVSHKIVSILVFLESVFRQLLELTEELDELEFQSLFFWNRYFDFVACICELVSKKFQSLFFWNRYFDLVHHSLESNMPCVSILVFLESVFRQQQLYALLKGLESFNPCFSGIGISTVGTQDYSQLTVEVSILVFLESVFRPDGFLAEYFSLTIVSILVFLESVFRHFTTFDMLYRTDVFQSLFFWNRYFDRTSHGLLTSFVKVSILVFLESVFRRNYFTILRRKWKSFNPCFSGIGISTSTLNLLID